MRPRLRDVSHGMYGAWRLAWLDPTAMAWFDRSIGGVWRSFWAMAIIYPFFIIEMRWNLAPTQWAVVGGPRILLLESIGYVIACVGFPLLIIPFCDWLERDAEVVDFIIAFNWSQILQTALFFPIDGIVASGVLPDSIGAFLLLGAFVATLTYEWFVARIALDVAGIAATAIVLIDIVFGALVHRLTQSLY
jgi:hypothetical protein